MIYYLLWPFLSILLIVLQNTAADIIFSGRLVLEISLVVVIYAGFRFNLIKGAISAFILGLVFDCIAGSALGLFALIYVIIFLFSFFMSAWLVIEKSRFIALFTLICTFLEEFIVILFYNLVYGFELHNALVVFLPQALIISLLAPVFFYLMRKVEVFSHGEPAQSAERTRTGRIPAEA